MIITIDGKVGTGKSTVAIHLARAIAYIYFDTGAMYRAFTYMALKEGITPDDKDALLAFVDQFDYRVKVSFGERRYLVGEEDVTNKLRTREVTKNVSRYAAIKEVRDRLVAIQRRFAQGVNAVFEGRDMGTVVFPDAEVKVFLTADPLVRAQRRFEEIVAKYPDQAKNLTLEQCLKNINERDEIDSTRDISPLRQAEDAEIIDTTNLTIDEVVYRIQEQIEKL